MKHVLVTRPAHQAQALIQAIEAAGHQAYGLPLFAIEPVEYVFPESVEDVIFTSVNAVMHVDISQLGSARVFAIGQATCQALLQRGIVVTATPELSNSEGLLALDILDSVDGRRMAIVTGQGGRRLLARKLQSRGGVVTVVPVYRRVETLVQGDLEKLFIKHPMTHVMLTSEQSVQRFFVLCQQENIDTQALTFILMSQRLARSCRQLGLQQPLSIAEHMSDQGLIQALQKSLSKE